MKPGERLSHYEILGEIGAGGMGVVYQARDTRLGRDVAIKISAEKFSERFEREARVIASLNHPNICTLYDVGPNYLVMEYIEGASPKGPLPLDEALRIAAQIAEALDAAHEKGITHRDLKPANIKVRPDGTVKVLDFGLAKLTPPNRDREGADAPTLTMGMSEAGQIMGTAAYMSPEQARGEQVDKRSDIWAYGVVLYELLTGKRLFEGRTVSDILAAVLMKEPDLSAAPAKARKLLQACLERDPKRRLRDIGEAWRLLEAGLEPAQALRPVTRWPWIAAVLPAVVVAALALWAPWRAKPPAPEVVRFQINGPEGTDTSSFGVSPDGRKLAFLVRGTGGKYRIWVRFLDALQAREVAGTEISTNNSFFWSPDSRFLAFDQNGKLSKVDLNGNPPQVIADVPGIGAIGGSWNREGTIVFGTISGVIMKVPASGGTPVPVTQRDAASKDLGHLAPLFFPDGRRFLYIRPDNANSSPVFTASLDVEPAKQESKPINGLPNGAWFVASTDAGPGTMLFQRQTSLLAQTFDVERRELTGEPVTLAESVVSYGASDNGVLVYTAGAGQKAQLTWLDRQGKTVGTVGEPSEYRAISFSPDPNRAAVVRIDEAGDASIWLMDLARNNSTRFTFRPGLSYNQPVWSPDGSRVVFQVFHGSGVDIYQKPVNETSEEQILLQNGELNFATSWSPDGRFLLYNVLDPKNKGDIGVLPLEGERKPVRLLATEFEENNAFFSPDGKRIAYVSEESGRPEVYVRPFLVDAKGTPSVGPKTLVSKGGGSGPHWRKDGKELGYSTPDRNLMVMEVTANPTSPFGEPKVLFKVPAGSTAGRRTDDHQRFLAAIPTSPGSAAPFNVVLNWQAGLRK